MPTLRELLASYTVRLENAGADSPRLSAELLLAHSMGVERGDIIKKCIMNPGEMLDGKTAARAETLIRRRENGEPAAYILGAKEFYGRRFQVTPATLVPRPDTETLVEAALVFAASHAGPHSPLSFIDLGTGSGAIAVTLALELPSWRGLAVDISSEALAVAARNARNLGASNLAFACCDFLSPELPQGPYDLLVANPPYVSEREYGALSREVTDFEPKSALVPAAPNADGFEHLFAVMNMGTRMLRPGGLLLMEMGFTQGDTLLRRAQASSAWADCRILHDLAGLPRVFRATRNPPGV